MVLSLTFVGLAAVIVAAAMTLAKFADDIADVTGMGGSVTGLVLLAGATSLPEFSVGYAAISQDAPDLAAGGVLGSSLVNLLILALVDLIARRPCQILTRKASAHAISATVGFLLAAIILIGLLTDYDEVFFRAGPASWAVVAAYILCARLVFLDQKETDGECEKADEAKSSRVDSDEAESGGEDQDEVDAKRPNLLVACLGFAAATAVIYFTAPLLSAKGDEIAEVTGLGRTFIGTLLLAAVTSLPEAVSTIAAVRLGAPDMAIGNIFGSNAFNMLIFACLDFTTDSSLLSVVSETHAITAACALGVTAIGLMSILYQPKKKWWLFEPDAALIAILVVGSLYLVYANS